MTKKEQRLLVARKLYKETKDILAVKHLLGHKDLRTTLHYLQRNLLNQEDP